VTSNAPDAAVAAGPSDAASLTEIGRRAARTLSPFLLPAVPVLGLIIYGILRQLYALFYGSLGASPEEVGLGYSEILALSALGVVWVSALAFPVLLAFAIFAARDRIDRADYILCNFPWLSTLSAGVGSIAVALILWFVIVPQGRIRDLQVLVSVGVVLVLMALLMHRATRVRHHRPVLGATLFVIYALFLGTALLWGVTQRDVRDAYAGFPVTSVNIAGLQVLGLRAEPATVTWKGSPPPAMAYLSQRCVMYLGESSDSVVVFDPGPDYVRTIRLQRIDVIVTVIRAGDIGTSSTGNVRCRNAKSPSQVQLPGVLLQR
jgi:hypothetical protein